MVVSLEGFLPWTHLVSLLLVKQSALIAEDVFTGNLGRHSEKVRGRTYGRHNFSKVIYFVITFR